MHKSPSLSVMRILMPAAQDLLHIIRIAKGHVGHDVSGRVKPEPTEGERLFRP